MQTHQLCESLKAACEQMAAHTQELCLLDTGIGDGDHGITVERGFLAAAQALSTFAGQSAEDMLSAVGESMAQSMGGAIGPLYGAFWRSFAQVFQKGDESSDHLGDALMAGCMQVMKLGRANAGDKTVVDAMLPCAKAAMEGTGTLLESLALGAEAAMAGAKATKDMAAKKGRARFLQEKSLGHMDPGAYSFALFIGHWAQQALALEQEVSL